MINAKKIQFAVRESRWTMPVIYHMKKAAYTQRNYHTIKAEDRNCFLCHFFTQLIHFLCFIRDVILKKAKTSS